MDYEKYMRSQPMTDGEEIRRFFDDDDEEENVTLEPIAKGTIHRQSVSFLLGKGGTPR